MSLSTAHQPGEMVPNFTSVAPVNPIPVIVTIVPSGGPLTGEIPVTTGEFVYVYLFEVVFALVPPGVVMVTLTVPVEWGGVTAVICVSRSTT